MSQYHHLFDHFGRRIPTQRSGRVGFGEKIMRFAAGIVIAGSLGILIWGR